MTDQSRHSSEDRAVDRIREQKARLDTAEITSRLLAHDRAALSQAITLVESTHLQHRDQSAEILKACLPHSGRSIRIGITGVPGVGKSTFIDAFGEYIVSIGKKVAVLAIDPSSASSGGSILGDKTRMVNLSMNPQAFIRPSPSSNTLGGVARKTRESIILCEAAGFDVILVETVGVGQSETAVHGMTDFFLLLMLAGAGDQLQGIKRGIMEMADGMMITKADGENAKTAMRAEGDYQSALHLFPPRSSSWMPKVLSCSAMENKGIRESWEMITDFEAWMKSRDLFEPHRHAQDESWMTDTIHQLLVRDFFDSESNMKNLELAKKKIADQEFTPFEAAEWVLKNRKQDL